MSPAKHSDFWQATHRDHFVRRLSVRLSVRLSHFFVTLSKAMFRRRHMYSSECCHYFLLCRLRSIATHRDHFVRRLSVRLSVRLSHFSVTLSKAMFRRRHIHSSECCHYFLKSRPKAPLIRCLSVVLKLFDELKHV